MDNDLRRGILFIPLSANADSMMNIINIVFSDECCKKNELPLVDKICFLYSMDYNAQIRIEDESIDASTFYCRVKEKIGKSCVEIRQRAISNYAKDIPIVIMDAVKEVGKEKIIIDLTCGKKDITGSLYTAASISQIHNMIYIDVPRINGVFPKFDRTKYEETMQDKFKLTRYQSLNEIEDLATLNQMDFIFYKKNVDEIRQSLSEPGKPKKPKLESYCAQLGHIIEGYFSGKPDDYCNAIREMGLINEELVKSVAERLIVDHEDLLKDKKEKRSINIIRNFGILYMAKETPDEVKKKLDYVFSINPALFEMFEIFRLYRNKASHYRNHGFKKEDVKLLLDMMLLLFNCIIESGLADKIWEDEIIE